MVSRNHALSALVTCALSLGAASAFGQTISYDFTPVAGTGNGDGATINTSGSGTGAANQVVVAGSVAGSSATFSASGPDQLQFGQNTGLYSSFSGYLSGGATSPVLQEIPNSVGGDTLNIAFSSAQNSVSFDFALGDFFGANGNDVLDITTNTGATYTATANAFASDLYPEGTFTLTSATAFTSLSLTSANPANTMTVADFSTTPVPEPSSLAMMGAGLALAWVVARRRRD